MSGEPQVVPEAEFAELEWDYPNPFVIRVLASAGDIDVLDHVNNGVYLRWMEQVAWAHSQSCGIDWNEYHRLNRAMVARRHEIDYLAACFEGDRILASTWIAEPSRIGLKRYYQLIREQDRRTVLRAKTQWVCMDLKRAKPARMPPEFVEAYRPTA